MIPTRLTASDRPWRNIFPGLPFARHAALAAVVAVSGMAMDMPAFAADPAGQAAAIEVGSRELEPLKRDLDARVLAVGGQPLLVDREALAALPFAGRHVLRNVPIDALRTLDLEVERMPSPLDGADCRVVDRFGRDLPAAKPDIEVFVGRVAGKPDSRVFFALSEGIVQGFVNFDDEQFVLSNGSPLDPHAPSFFDTGSPAWKAINWRPWTCGTLEVNVDQAEEISPPATGESSLVPTCRVVEIAIDTDADFRDLFTTDAKAYGYLGILVAATSHIYQTDLSTNIVLNYARLWTSPDPWTAPDTAAALPQFAAYWEANMGFVSRDLAHLVSADDLGGGRAFLNALCPLNPSVRYAVSGNIEGWFPTPVYPSIQNWDLMVFAHELGHNCAGIHTHEVGIYPGSNQLYDGCGIGDCSEARDLGTIMSYCHLCPGGLSNIRLEFSPPNITAMTAYLAGRPCVSTRPCAPDPSCVVAISPTSLSIPNLEPEQPFEILVSTVGSSCSYAPTNLPPWIRLVSQGTTGSWGYLQLAAEPNPDFQPRDATFIVSGPVPPGSPPPPNREVTVSQAACSATLASASILLPSYAGESSIFFTTTTQVCAWTAQSTAPSWLTVLTASGTGDSAVTFSFAANPSGAAREGTIEIGDKTFLVVQNGMPWSPVDLPAVEAWFKADAIPPADRVGSLVTRWVDSTGMFPLDASGTARPQFVSSAQAGKPAVRFDGVNDGLTRGSSPLLRNVDGGAIFAVRRRLAGASTSQRSVAFIAAGSGASNPRLAMGTSASGMPESLARRLDANATSTVAGSTPVPTGFQIQAVVSDYASGTASQWISGVQQGTAAMTTGVTSNTNAIGFALGRGVSASSYFYGDIGEVVVVRGAVSTDVRQRIEGYLAHRWNMAADLPSNHPYRTAPPGASCQYILATSSATIPGDAGTGTISFSGGGSSCGWTASSGAAWISVSPAGGVGPAGTVVYSFEANDGLAPRTATLSIAGTLFTVTQEGNAWLPSDLAGIESWYQADAIPAGDRSGGMVSRWISSAGSFPLTGSGRGRPRFIENAVAGKSVVRFDGIDDGLGRGASALLRNVDGGAIFVVRRHASPPSSTSAIAFLSTGLRKTDPRLALGSNQIGRPEANARRLDGQATSLATASSPTLTGFQLQGAVADYAVGSLAQWMDGSVAGTAVMTAGLTSNTNPLGFVLGRSFSAGSHFAGDLAEVLLVRGTLTVCDRQRIEGYLAHRWGIASNLPANHPFRNEPPVAGQACAPGLLAAVPGMSTVSVPESFPTLQAAVDAAENGTVIRLGPGVHAGGVTISGKSLTIEGNEGPVASVLEGAGQVGTVLRVEEGAKVRLVGVSVRGGLGGTPVDLGDGSWPFAGGGILVQGASLEIDRCVIEHNLAGNGGGIAAIDSTVQIASSSLVSNHAAMQGGGLWAVRSSMESSTSEIRFNVAGGEGGGVHADEPSVLTFLGTSICDNEPDASNGSREGLSISCEACLGDLDGNGSIGNADLAVLLGVWGDAGGLADLDGDGMVFGGDLATLLGRWGMDCTP
jgi:hypothetical protein